MFLISDELTYVIWFCSPGAVAVMDVHKHSRIILTY